MADPGEAGGARPPLFLDETEVRRAEKTIFGDRSPLCKGMDDRPPPLPTLISRSGGFRAKQGEI